MKQYEYKVVPAPAKGLKAQGLKSPEARYAHAIETLMNELAGDGWDYQRADTLPSTERAGLTGSTTEWRHLLIFRRALPTAQATAAPAPVAAEQQAAPAPVPAPVPVQTAAPAPVQEAALRPEPAVVAAKSDPEDDDAAPADEQKSPRLGATHMLSDNGVEETSEVSGMTSSLQNLASNRNRLKGVTRDDK
ncbi:DUF4177 domain-containing protein [Pseudosulfitobacter sp. DSM 107133]|uniref:DUF4177 domain-containing protein n=1 Tax=Pseudosulfitobacter sp. DSM 107133 TaxID=2883100 RepID=UPI000DF20834|nr:DUF4177 domain-containing protein [Pseudosulfitobacter sp. DSM 107133]UOA27695.1 hypothetical protein DSM107133_02427 [Pseudosulfitobacter sp. DSM 107133]